MNYDSYLENEEVCVDDIAKLLEVSRKSAIQRMARLVKRHQAVRLSMPTVGNPARFRLLVSKESLLHTQKFAGPKMNREINWGKFCSDPFGMDKERGDGMNEQTLETLAVSPSQAAKIIGLQSATLEKDRRLGHLGIPFVKAGRRILYRFSDLQDWLEKHKQTTSRSEVTPEVCCKYSADPSSTTRV
jgi:hypothetical protein